MTAPVQHTYSNPILRTEHQVSDRYGLHVRTGTACWCDPKIIQVYQDGREVVLHEGGSKQS